MTNSAASVTFSQISLLSSDPQILEGSIEENSVISSSTVITTAVTAAKAKDLPPMLSQYLEYKNKYSECIIFFQVGDFYEVFFEDAVKVAKAINITLTSRDKSSDQPIPMCGVPVAALDGYLERLVDQGFSAAVVSQQNTSSLSRLPSAYKEENSNSKLVISRQLSRIVTPGIRLLSNNQNNSDSAFILSVHVGASQTGLLQQAGIAYCEAQSGKVFCKSVLSEAELIEEIVRISPTEIIFPHSVLGSKLDGRSGIVRKLQSRIIGVIFKYRDSQETDLRKLDDLTAFQALEVDCKQAARRLINYIDETTNGAKITFSTFEPEGNTRVMQISSTTRANLELLTSPTAGTQSSVLFDLNNTKTAAGSRLFKAWLLRPLIDKNQIEARYDFVEYLKDSHNLSDNLRKSLELCADLERIASRIELNCVSPRELGALRDFLRELKDSAYYQELFSQTEAFSVLQQICNNLKTDKKLLNELEERLEDNLPAVMGDAYVIRQGFSPELDQFRAAHKDGRSWVQAFEQKEQQVTGLNNLKVKFNYVLGFFIEVTKSNASKVPAHYEKRQSTVNAERFVTTELKAKEKTVLGAEENSLALERELYQKTKADLMPFCDSIRNAGRAIAELDVFLSLADTANRRSFIRPELTDSTEFILNNGRHPVVESSLGSSFVPNSLRLNDKSDQKSALILTGPNMGGKSTFLRQAGILAIMAQMGSFVPAESFRLGIVDQIFARIGASDNIAGGESTFMVEMKEVVQIVSASTSKSLILIDEVGRGTSTKDGEALAQAIVEWLVQNKNCRMLFATHFHELTDLISSFSMLDNICVEAAEHKGEIVFTHKIASGAAGQSYGLEVARLAGLPREIIKRGREIVRARNISAPVKASQVMAEPDFRDTDEYKHQKQILDQISQVDLNNISPMQSLILLQELQKKIRSS